jgi:hypothetical protein
MTRKHKVKRKVVPGIKEHAPLEPQVPNQAVLITQAPVEPTQDQLYSKMTIKQLPVTIQKPSLGGMYNQERLQTFKVAAKDTFIDSLVFCRKVKMAADGGGDATAPVIVINIYTV